MNFKRNKKHISRNIIIDKTIIKRKKAKDKKQETKNKEHIVEQSLGIFGTSMSRCR